MVSSELRKQHVKGIKRCERRQGSQKQSEKTNPQSAVNGNKNKAAPGAIEGVGEVKLACVGVLSCMTETALPTEIVVMRVTSRSDEIKIG